MRRWPTIALVFVVALSAALATLAVAAAMGMSASEIAQIASMLGPAIVATVVSAALARPLFRATNIRNRLLAVALVAAGVSLANLAVLVALMFVRHDALVVAALLVYSGGAGVGAALALSRTLSQGLKRLSSTADRLAAGDLDARAGRIQGGPELESLGRALDDMAGRLQATQMSERRAQQVKGDLITAMSHDLRTPLSRLRAMVEAIDDKVVGDKETVERYVREMRVAVESVSALVDDLFELVKLDAAALKDTELSPLSDVVAAAIADCEGQALDKGLQLVTRLEGAGDGQCSPRLARVISNLVQNAIRHTPADGSVTVQARRSNGSLEVSVTDTGEGIKPEELTEVFEPFWRGDTARSSPGSGLGLALAKRIVEALGGGIKVESAGGRGSTFAVSVPDRAGG